MSANVQTFWKNETEVPNEVRNIVYDYRDGTVSFNDAVQKLVDKNVDISDAMELLDS